MEKAPRRGAAGVTSCAAGALVKHDGSHFVSVVTSSCCNISILLDTSIQVKVPHYYTYCEDDAGVAFDCQHELHDNATSGACTH